MIVLLLVSSCSPVVEQPVSGPITLESQWMEITPPEPLKVTKNEQAIRLELTGLVDMRLDNTLELSDARSAVITGELVDDEGTVYPLALGGIAGSHALFYRAGDYPPGPDYPVDRTIVTLRLRSDTSVDVNEIRWICSTTP